MKMIKSLLVVAVLSASVWALPPQVEADKLALGAKASMDTGDFKAALEKLERLKSLNVKLPDAYWYYYGNTLLSLKKGQEAITAFDKYLEQGVKAKYYKEALEQYDLAERVIKDNTPFIDLNTGLMWQDNVDTTKDMSWMAARSYCENLDLAGYSDWRLPSAEMIKSLFNQRQLLKHPGLGLAYWTISGSNKPEQVSFNYALNFFSFDSLSSMTDSVRCVRNNR